MRTDFTGLILNGKHHHGIFPHNGCRTRLREMLTEGTP
jgi:hypothetical protein